jgi:hypothetical protein
VASGWNTCSGRCWRTRELADEAMLDLVDPAGTREAQGLDMLMLLAS